MSLNLKMAMHQYDVLSGCNINLHYRLYLHGLTSEFAIRASMEFLLWQDTYITIGAYGIFNRMIYDSKTLHVHQKIQNSFVNETIGSEIDPIFKNWIRIFDDQTDYVKYNHHFAGIGFSLCRHTSFCDTGMKLKYDFLKGRLLFSVFLHRSIGEE